MNLEQLKKQFDIEKQISVTEGENGIPFIHIHNNAASAIISLYGGQVLSYKPTSKSEMLFLSKLANYQSGAAIKGGIPVCWPWFGADPDNKGRQAHGFARNKMWKIISTEKINDVQSKVVLSLSEDEESMALWPHSFNLSLEILVSDKLHLKLKTQNTDTQKIKISQALHTYFSVKDIGATSLQGLDTTKYLDKAKINKADEEKIQSGAVEFTQEVDRIYLDVPHTLQLVDRLAHRLINISSAANKSTVVWNPGADISKQMSDLQDNDYQQFVCVETANAATDVISIEPGDSFEILASYAVSNLESSD